MSTLNDIKVEYYIYLMEAEAGALIGFDQYLTENYTQVYDGALNFLGYERTI